MKLNHILLLSIVFPVMLWGQDTGVPLHAPTYAILQRLSLKTGIGIDLSSLPVGRNQVYQFARQCDSSRLSLSESDRADIRYLLADNNEYGVGYRLDLENRLPIFRYFYPVKGSLVAIDKPDFMLRANPILHVGFGKEQNVEGFVFANQRGVELRARIGKKLNIFTNLIESQTRFPTYISQWVNENQAIPGNGFYKTYKSRVSDVTGYDFSNSSAYISSAITKQISFQFGHGRHFIGQGYRSMFLSDFSNNYLYFKLHSTFWRFTYDNYFTNLAEPIASSSATPGRTQRFAAFHHLNFRASKRLNIGVFETVAFRRDNGFELQYLNPVILYRTVEYGFKSADNILLGLDMDYRVAKSVKLYGQLLLDEFSFAGVFQPDKKGWWGNKIASQLGLKYINVLGADHLEVQVEWNTARPYTYSHFDSLSNWTHFGQPLAHPLGANFSEIVTLLRYQPHPRWTVQGRYLYFITGENEAGNNWGGNPNLTYTTRPREYGNYIGQGIHATTALAALDINYQMAHNLFLDVHLLWRDKKSDLPARTLNSLIFGAGLRLNFWDNPSDF